MNTNYAPLLAACMLTAVTLLPVGLGHSASTGSDKPTGVYVGSVGPWVHVAGIIDPGFTFAIGHAECDREILSDGDDSTTEDAEHDEPEADGAATQSSGSVQPNGMWDDGGYGGVCHTPDTHYVTQLYNTQECSYSDAYANDAVLGGGVAISTACDFRSSVISVRNPTPIDIPLNLAACIIDSVRTVNPVEVFGCSTTAVGEALAIDPDQFIECFIGDLTPDSCPPGAGGFTCGPDGSADVENAGAGGAGVPYPATNGCDSTDGVAAVFVRASGASTGDIW